MKPSQKSRALNRTQTRLELRGLRPNTVTSYLRGARQFLEAVDKTPGRVTQGDVEQYLLGLRTGGRSVSTRNVALASIRFLLQSTTRRDVSSTIPHCRQPRTLVTVLSGSELERRLAATKSPMYRAIFVTAYGAGLRIGEVRHLRFDDIQSKRGLIHIRDGKSGERYAPLGRRVFTIGEAIPQNAEFPPWVVDIHSAIRSVDVAYHMNHRKAGEVMFDPKTEKMLEGIGHYGYEEVAGKKLIRTACDNPYPCAFDHGIITAMAKRFESKSDVTHDAGGCRKEGKESCTYLIRW